MHYEHFWFQIVLFSDFRAVHLYLSFKIVVFNKKLQYLLLVARHIVFWHFEETLQIDVSYHVKVLCKYILSTKKMALHCEQFWFLKEPFLPFLKKNNLPYLMNFVECKICSRTCCTFYYLNGHFLESKMFIVNCHLHTTHKHTKKYLI